MKVQIDTQAKTISISESITLSDLEILKKWITSFGDEWLSYSIVPTLTVITDKGHFPWTPIGVPHPLMPPINPIDTPYKIWCSVDNKVFKIET